MTNRQQSPAFFPKHFFDGSDAYQTEQFLEMARRGGLRAAHNAGRWTIRSDGAGVKEPNIQLKSLQTRAGSLRGDAEATLTGGATLASPEDAERAAATVRNDPWTREMSITNSFEEFAMDLATDANTIRPVRRFLERHQGVRLFVLRTTERFRNRDTIWRLMTRADESGETLVNMTQGIGRWPSSDEISGTSHVFCTHLVGTPVFARGQPLAAAFTSIRGAQLIVLADGVFNRPFSFGGWPVATSDWLTGRAEEIRAPRPAMTSISEGEALLRHSTRQANRLVELLTDPNIWADRSGRIRFADRIIASSTIDFGFNTIAAMSKDWQSSESIWTAFRALDVLQGLWEGPHGGSVKRRVLLDPEIIRGHALPTIEPRHYKTWAEMTVGVYEEELERMYARTPPKERPARLAELRNLVHGTGVQPSGQRTKTDRLKALRGVGDGGVQLVKYVAAIWWAALLMSPETHAFPGSPPMNAPTELPGRLS